MHEDESSVSLGVGLICMYVRNLVRTVRTLHNKPPPEFPLASPYSGIVHHLSGPNRYALTQTFHQRIMVGRCCCLRLASFTFITRVGFSTSTLAYMLDSLVRVSRRVGKNHFGKIARSTLRPLVHQHAPAESRSSPGVARPMRTGDPILPDDSEQNNRFPKRQLQAFDSPANRRWFGNSHRSLPKNKFLPLPPQRFQVF